MLRRRRSRWGVEGGGREAFISLMIEGLGRLQSLSCFDFDRA